MDGARTEHREGTRLAGGKRNGPMVRPTVLTVTHSPMKMRDEEIFGPVVAVELYEHFSDAIAAVNASRDGLLAWLTRDAGHIQEAFRALEVGALIVDDAPTWRLDAMPYGGVKDSGEGRKGVRCAIDEMTERRLLAMALPSNALGESVGGAGMWERRRDHAKSWGDCTGPRKIFLPRGKYFIEIFVWGCRTFHRSCSLFFGPLNFLRTRTLFFATTTRDCSPLTRNVFGGGFGAIQQAWLNAGQVGREAPTHGADF
jgi:hypothetical protein